MPEKFDLTFTNEEGQAERVVMIHAAIMGSIERFLSVLLEHHAGALPLWLSPVQASVLPISDDQLGYAETIQQQLAAAGVRAEIDSRSESIGKKIREAEVQKIPVMLIVGKKEAAAEKVSLRTREKGDEGQQSVADVTARLTQQIAERR
jgi:threonyl-tRNA synthetase